VPRSFLPALALLPLVALVPGACQPPTQITLDISTDADCSSFETSIFVEPGPSFTDGGAPQTATTECSAGRVGTLVLTPSGARNGRVLVRVVGRAPGLGDIVASRSIRYLERRPLVLPIRLSRACAGVPCRDGTTCVDGLCRSWDVDPETCLSDGGCGEGTLPALDGGSVDAGPDAGPREPVVELAAGVTSTCAHLAGGSVRCWGGNPYGECGDGTSVSPRSTPAPPVPANSGAIGIAAGDRFACDLLTPGGRVECWGRNNVGQLGRGTTFLTPGLVPAPVGLVGEATALSAAWGHACALVPTAMPPIYCWGDGTSSSLGTPLMQSPTPVGVAGLGGAATAIAVGRFHACALVGTLPVCWGAAPGNGAMAESPPDVVPGIPDAVGIAAGADHTCVIRSNRHATCFGNDVAGQCGLGSSSPVPTAPGSGDVLMGPGAPLTDVREIAGGINHSCALVMGSAGGEVWCWGGNSRGQLGDGKTMPSPYAKRVQGLPEVEHVATGAQHSCATVRGGGVRCWGANAEGQLGNGTIVDALAPVPVQGL
jgi:alpha-tubulin suppressor-like RCC1 family protein